MNDNNEFFARRQGAAIIKHELLSRYIRLFCSKTGKYAAGRKVVYVDGYAGPGRYEDGNPASPLIAADVAGLVESIRDLQCIFIEKEGDYADQLTELLGDALPIAQVWRGEMADYIDDVLEVAKGVPMLAFVDPFGLGLSFEDLSRLTKRSEPTDIIMNVSLSGIRRNAGHLTSEKSYPAQRRFVAKLDTMMGGDWWQDIWRKTGDAEKIAFEYARRCMKLRGSYFIQEVRDRWNGPTAFYLMLLTKHEDGLWHFAEFTSYAHDALRAADPNVLADDAMLITPQMEWVEEIKRNIVALLAKDGDFVIGRNLPEVYGKTLGFARSMNVRKAIKELHSEGRTSTDGKGDVQQMRARRI